MEGPTVERLAASAMTLGYALALCFTAGMTVAAQVKTISSGELPAVLAQVINALLKGMSMSAAQQQEARPHARSAAAADEAAAEATAPEAAPEQQGPAQEEVAEAAAPAADEEPAAPPARAAAPKAGRASAARLDESGSDDDTCSDDDDSASLVYVTLSTLKKGPNDDKVYHTNPDCGLFKKSKQPEKIPAAQVKGGVNWRLCTSCAKRAGVATNPHF